MAALRVPQNKRRFGDWLNTKLFDGTKDEKKSQGWTALVLDTNGNGKRDDYVEPDQPLDPSKDKRIAAAFYGVTVSPADGSIWGTVLGFPGGIVRLVPGSNPPATALAELYELPWNNPNASVHGFSPRGLDVDRIEPPPEEWASIFAALARECSLDVSLSDGFEIVRGFVAKIQERSAGSD